MGRKADDIVILYILLRTDVASLIGTPDHRKTGLPCAQTGHAANQMVYELRQKEISSQLSDLFEWEGQTGRGFGTEIVLDGGSISSIKQIVDFAKLNGIHAGITHDPEYPLWDGDTLHLIPLDTCAYMFGRKSALAPILSKYKLMP